MYENLQEIIDKEKEKYKLFQDWRERQYGVIKPYEPNWWEKIGRKVKTGYEWLAGKMPTVEKFQPVIKQLQPKLKGVPPSIKQSFSEFSNILGETETKFRDWLFAEDEKIDPALLEAYAKRGVYLGNPKVSDILVNVARMLPGQENLPDWGELTTGARVLVVAQNAALIPLITGIAIMGGDVVAGVQDWAKLHKFKIWEPTTEIQTIKGYTLGGKPYTEKRIVPTLRMRPTYGTVSISKTFTEAKYAIKPITYKVVETVKFKSTVEKQLYDLVGKVAKEFGKSSPTSIQMKPFIKTAHHYIATPIKGLVDPGYGQTVYNQINAALPTMLNEFITLGEATAQIPKITPEEKIVEKEIAEPLEKVSPYGEEYRESVMREIIAEEKTIIQQVKEKGGIKYTESIKDYGKFKEIPLSAKSKTGLPLDEMADELNMSEDDLWEALIEPTRVELYAGMPVDPEKLAKEVKNIIKPEVKPLLPAAEKVFAHLSPTPKRPLDLSLGRLYTLTVDELYPLKKYTDIIKKVGMEVLPEEDPFILASQHRGWHGKADTFFHYKTFDVNYNWIGKPLNEILKPVGDNLDNFDSYLIARAQIERHKGGIETGIPIEDARAAVEELEKTYPDFRRLSDEINEYQDTLLKYARDSELISDKTYGQFKALNPFYVPFYRVLDIAGRKGLLGRGVVNLPNIFREIKGSERPIIRPTESIVKNTYTIIDAAERNQIALSLVRLAEKYPKQFQDVIAKVRTPIARVAAVSIDEIQSQLKTEGIEIPDELADEMINIFRPSIFAPGENTIRVLENGKRSFYQVDPDIYKSLTSLDRESANLIIKMLSFPARMLRLGATTFAPEFIVRNPVRDSITAFCWSKYGFVPGIDTTRGLFSMIGRDEMYWRWKMSGAEHSMLVSLDRKYLQKNIRDLISAKGAKLVNMIKHPLDTAALLSELGEEMTRLGEFKLGMGGGNRWFLMAEKLPEDLPLKSRVLNAGKAAREVTLDFARLGSKTRAVNQIIAFWNANVQGMDKMARSFKDHPIRTLYKILLGITIPSTLLYLSQKDDPRYQEIPQWQKDLFWIILTKENIYRIPKPFEMGIIFGTGAERILEYIEEKDPKVFKDLGKAIMRGASPGFLPTAFQSPVEVAANYSFFLDRPIVSPGLKNLPPEMQYTIYTKETSKIIGKAFKVSPKKVESLVKGMTGGGGTLAFETLDQILRVLDVTDAPEKPTASLADIPLVRGFVVREPIGSASESVNKFYEMYENGEAGYLAIKELLEAKKFGEIERYAKKYPEYKYIQVLRTVAQRLSKLRSTRIKIWESEMDPQSKRNLINEIEKAMTESARLIVGLVEAATK